MITVLRTSAFSVKGRNSGRIRRAAWWPVFLPRLLLVAALALASLSVYTKYQRHVAGDFPVVDATSSRAADAAAPVTQAAEAMGPGKALVGLFGDAKAKPAPKARRQEAPPTPLKLRLLAVMASDRQGEGLAVIAEQRNAEKGYQVGNEIPGGATLEQVLVDRVIISRNGRQETLMLTDGKPAPNASAGGSRRTASVREGTNKPISSREASAVTGNGDTRVLPELADYQAKLSSDPKRLTGLLRFRPVRQGQTLKGYRVFPGRNPSLLGRAGLRVGDIITSANGVQLSSENAGKEVIAQLAHVNSLELEVLRNGKLRAVTLATQ